MALYAFDGTWNNRLDDDDEVNDTNVAKFCAAYDGTNKKYLKGVGTRLGWFGKLIGGMTGAGGHPRIREMHEQLCKFYVSGDKEIDIVGFSRGAALALHFANYVRKKGIRHPETKKRIVKRPAVRFLGLWDVVGAFGIPFNILWIPFQKINLSYNLKLSKSVQYCFHALALDERRQTFRPTRVKKAYEVWFRGAHSDIGGGNGNLALNTIGLRWMLNKAMAAGLPVNTQVIDGLAAYINPEVDIQEAGKDLIKNKWRKWKSQDAFHYTAVTHHAKVNPLPENRREETLEEEKMAQPVA